MKTNYTPLLARSRGFTLIELLVVIVIIALLVSILMPSLSKARAMAKFVQCLSNLRNAGIIELIYASENNRYIPGNSTTSGPNGPVGWDVLLLGATWSASSSSYVGNMDALLHCPSDNSLPLSNSNSVIRSYVMNDRYWDPFSGITYPGGIGIPLNAVPQPIDTVCLFEQWTGVAVYNFGYAIEWNASIDSSYWYHEGSANMQFFDGHAATMTAEQFVKESGFSSLQEYFNAGGALSGRGPYSWSWHKKQDSSGNYRPVGEYPGNPFGG